MSMTPDKQAEREEAFAGLLFDFMGFLTSGETRWKFSAYDEASPGVHAIEQFAEKRGLKLDEANVSGWHTPPAAAEAPAVADEVLYRLAQQLWEQGHISDLSRTTAAIFGRAVLATFSAQPKADSSETQQEFINRRAVLEANLYNSTSWPKDDSTDVKQAADAFVSDPEWKKLDSTEAPDIQGLHGYLLSQAADARTHQSAECLRDWARAILALRPKAQPLTADMFWDHDDIERFGHDIDEIVADYGPGEIVKIDQAKHLPTITVRVIVDPEDYDRLTYEEVGIASSTKEGGSNE